MRTPMTSVFLTMTPVDLSFSKDSSGSSTMALRIPNSVDSARLNALMLMPQSFRTEAMWARRPGSLFEAPGLVVYENRKLRDYVVIHQITLVSTTLLAFPVNLGSSPGALSSTLT